MNTFIALSKKEINQMISEYKIIWLPIVFVLLGLTQPIMMYYLPLILETLGGVEGIIIDPTMTKPMGSEVLASTLNSQFDQLGIIVLVVAVMSVIQSEKANGMLAFILTRPVSISSYIGSKIFTHYLLAVLCIAIGYTVSYGYTAYLFTPIPISQMILAFVLYSIWVLFVITFVAMMSTFFTSPAFIALISIVFLLISRLCAGLNPIIDTFNPASMSLRATSILITGDLGASWTIDIIATLLIIFVMMSIMRYWIAKKKF